MEPMDVFTVELSPGPPRSILVTADLLAMAVIDPDGPLYGTSAAAWACDLIEYVQDRERPKA